MPGRFLGRLFCAGALAAALACGAGGAAAQTQAAAKRVALVIGNSAYKEGGTLKNPVNDARAMAATLRQLGFVVVARENATKQQMERAVGEFGDQLSAGSIALFYFAGHGMQVNGRNFLLPVDATITSEARVRLEALDVDLVLDQMAASASDMNLLVLDACRNNPFERRFRSRSGGLAQINAPKGTLIAYATAPGSVAADGDGVNGVYTAKLVSAIRTPGLPIEEVFKRVRVDVSRETGDAQTPWEASSLTGSFYFMEAPKVAALPPRGPSEADKEMMYWDSIKGSDDPEVLRAYLSRYPGGAFVDLARAKLAAVERRQRERAAAPPPISGEQAVWDLVKDLKDPAIFEAFLEKYPEGALAEAAALKLAALTREQKKTQLAAAPAAAPAASAAPSAESEDALWARVGNSGDPAKLREYLDRFPKGYYAATALFRLDAMPAATSQLAAAPAAAPARPAAPGGVDGIWHGSFVCAGGQMAGALNSTRHVFAVKQGRLSGKFEGSGFSETFEGTVAAGGKVVISGSGENLRYHRGAYSMSFEGKEEGGRFTAKGRSFGRDCTLVYSKVQ